MVMKPAPPPIGRGLVFLTQAVVAVSGTVWVDDVKLTVRPPDVYRRKFTKGVVLLNGSDALHLRSRARYNVDSSRGSMFICLWY